MTLLRNILVILIVFTRQHRHHYNCLFGSHYSFHLWVIFFVCGFCDESNQHMQSNVKKPSVCIVIVIIPPKAKWILKIRNKSACMTMTAPSWRTVWIASTRKQTIKMKQVFASHFFSIVWKCYKMPRTSHETIQTRKHCELLAHEW